MFSFSKQRLYRRQIKEKIHLLNQGDGWQIPWIFCSLIQHHHPSRILAADALDRSIQSMTFEQIIKTDLQMRQTTSMEWSIDWHTITIGSLFSPGMTTNHHRAIVIFASFHPNGYLREQAIHMMAEYESILPFLILRQNDWVLQVRTAADLAVQKRMNYVTADELCYALPFAEKIKGCKHHQSATIFFDYLTNPHNTTTMIRGLNSRELRTRRICIQALLASEISDKTLAFRQLKEEPDPFLRRMIFHHLMKQQENMDEYTDVFLLDKYPPNRLLALNYIQSKYAGQQVLLNIARCCLTDKHARVRHLAREIVTTFEPQFDFASFYRSQLELFAIPSILGLGETGQKEDCRFIETHLHNSNPSLVSAAITSLMRLNLEQYSHSALSLLDNPHAGVVKTAKNLIIKYRTQDYHIIKSLYDCTSYPYSKRTCASLLFTAPKWPRMIYMLQILSSPDETLQTLAIQALYRWRSSLNRFYGSPTLSQIETIRQLISANDEHLPPHLKKELLFMLR